MQNEKIRQIVEFKGPRCQLRQLQEEAAEVIRAVNKYLSRGELDHLLEELGDLDGLMDQMKYIFKDHWQTAEDKKRAGQEKILKEKIEREKRSN